MSTFAPEIAIFAPPLSQSDTAIPGSSLSWQRSSPTRESGHLRGNLRTSLTNGTAIVEEASAVQPISIRQRGARLSFLGGKPKSSQQFSGENSSLANMVGDGSESNSQYSKSKENLSRVLRTQSINTNSSSNHHHRNGSADAGALASMSDRSRKSRETVENSEGDLGRGEGGVMRINSVRKRLSILKLGKKPSRSNGLMGGLSEEQ